MTDILVDSFYMKCLERGKFIETESAWGWEVATGIRTANRYEDVLQMMEIF